MKISGSKFILITLFIVLIPICANWQLLLNGEKTEGVVVKTIEEGSELIHSFYAIVVYESNQKKYVLKGPENIEYPIGEKFQILYAPKNPKNAIIYSLQGIYFNRFTPVAFVLFVFWMAFYLSFSPKSEKRKSKKEWFKPNKLLNKNTLS